MSSIGTTITAGSGQHAARWLRYASPQAFLPLADRLIPWLHGAALLLGGLLAGAAALAPWATASALRISLE